MPDPDPTLVTAFGPLLGWAERTGRMHYSERRHWYMRADRDADGAERELRARPPGVGAPQEATPPVAAHKVTTARVRAELANHARVAAAGRAGVAPDSMAALLSEATSAAPPGRQPTLFPEGDLPSRTASGIPPTDLLKVPWQARRAVARAGPVDAYALIEQYSGEEGAIMAEIDAMGSGPLAADAADYKMAYERWASGFGSNG